MYCHQAKTSVYISVCYSARFLYAGCLKMQLYSFTNTGLKLKPEKYSYPQVKTMSTENGQYPPFPFIWI